MSIAFAISAFVALGTASQTNQDALQIVDGKLRVTEKIGYSPAIELLSKWAETAGIKIEFSSNFAHRKLDVFVRNVTLRNAMASAADALDMVWERTESGLRLVEPADVRARRESDANQFHAHNINRLEAYISAMVRGARTRLSTIESRLVGVKRNLGASEFQFDENEPQILGTLTADETLVSRPWMWACAVLLKAYGPNAAKDLYEGKFICGQFAWPSSGSPAWLEEYLAKSPSFDPSQHAHLLYGIHLRDERLTFQGIVVRNGSMDGMQLHPVRIARFETTPMPGAVDLAQPARVLQDAGDRIVDPSKFRPLGLWKSGHPLAEHWNGFHMEAGLNIIAESFYFKSRVKEITARKCGDIAHEIVARHGGSFSQRNGIVRYAHFLPRVLETKDLPSLLYRKWSDPRYGNVREAIEDVATLPFAKRNALDNLAISSPMRDRWHQVFDLGGLLACLPKAARIAALNGTPTYESAWPESARTEMRVRCIERAMLGDALGINVFSEIMRGPTKEPFAAILSTSTETRELLHESLKDEPPFLEFRSRPCRVENGHLYLGFTAERSIKVPFQFISFAL